MASQDATADQNAFDGTAHWQRFVQNINRDDASRDEALKRFKEAWDEWHDRMRRQLKEDEENRKNAESRFNSGGENPLFKDNPGITSFRQSDVGELVNKSATPMKVGDNVQADSVTTIGDGQDGAISERAKNIAKVLGGMAVPVATTFAHKALIVAGVTTIMPAAAPVVIPAALFVYSAYKMKGSYQALKNDLTKAADKHAETGMTSSQAFFTALKENKFRTGMMIGSALMLGFAATMGVDSAVAAVTDNLNDTAADVAASSHFTGTPPPAPEDAATTAPDIKEILAGQPVSPQVEQVLALMESDNPATAAQATKDMAYFMFNGLEGVEKDAAGAVELFKQAAEMGNTQAQVDLAYIQYNGLGGTDADPQAAIAALKEVQTPQAQEFLAAWTGESPAGNTPVPESPAFDQLQQYAQARVAADLDMLGEQTLARHDSVFTTAALEEYIANGGDVPEEVRHSIDMQSREANFQMMQEEAAAKTAADLQQMEAMREFRPESVLSAAELGVSDDRLAAFAAENNGLTFGNAIDETQQAAIVAHLQELRATDPDFAAKFAVLEELRFSTTVIEGDTPTGLQDGLTGRTYTLEINAADLNKEGFSLLDAAIGDSPDLQEKLAAALAEPPAVDTNDVQVLSHIDHPVVEHDQQMEAQLQDAIDYGLTTPAQGLVTVNPYDGGIFFTREIVPGGDLVTYKMTIPEGSPPMDFLNGAHVEVLDARGYSTHGAFEDLMKQAAQSSDFDPEIGLVREVGGGQSVHIYEEDGKTVTKLMTDQHIAENSENIAKAVQQEAVRESGIITDRNGIAILSNIDHPVVEHDQQMEAQMISAMESGLTTPDKGLVTVNPYDGGIFFTREIEPGSNDFVTYQMTVPEGQNPADFLNGAHVEILDPRGNSTQAALDGMLREAAQTKGFDADAGIIKEYGDTKIHIYQENGQSVAKICTDDYIRSHADTLDRAESQTAQMTQREPGFVEQKAGEIGRGAQETVTKEVNNKIDQVERETQTRVRNVIRDVFKT